MELLDYWTEKDCELCGVRFHYTRTERKFPPVDGIYMCSECREIEKQIDTADERVESMRTACINILIDKYVSRGHHNLGEYFSDCLNQIKKVKE